MLTSRRGNRVARFREEEGISMVVALLVSLVVFTLGATWAAIGTHSVTASGREAQRDKARNAAEAGLNLAMAHLAGDAAYAGTGLTALPGVGEFEVTVSPVSFLADDPRRLIVARGYAPDKAHPTRVARRLEQQVELDPTDGFSYALFAAPGGITGANRLTVNGDIYSADDLLLSNHSTVNGNVYSLAGVTTSNQSTVAGDVHAAGGVELHNSTTTVIGDVISSGGDVNLTGKVKGSVSAYGSITGGTVDGSRNPYSNPPPPPSQTLPTFTWDPANYPSATSWADPTLFQEHWVVNQDAFTGHHRVSCLAPCLTPIELFSEWAMTDDVTIVADGPVHLSRAIQNASSDGRTLTLTIVTLAPDLLDPLIFPFQMTNQIVLDDIRLVVYVPNGTARFSNLKSFSGAVYAAAIDVGQQFTLDFQPVEVPGFDWSVASASHFEIVAGPFREVPFS